MCVLLAPSGPRRPASVPAGFQTRRLVADDANWCIPRTSEFVSPSGEFRTEEIAVLFDIRSARLESQATRA